ncbi:transcriptional regulator [Leptolyngbya sp. Heron Island J]|uniref:phosphonate metabolism transcriptional regulator PhnF n=1 Tax=Leptolyngbya sp. Heron Island J TaxID=1385935 RepID=UPI0003B96EF3|nr:phosphonate metabolism transcriptional regulator PhnF [Leptolyngbya sp. Heron Island J]ESA33652.1 transcriptional regulator [Leptolyngbya sp. Heron Island J]
MFQSTQPVYVQIANDLRQTIQQGVYQIGDKLPSQQKLGERFGVNRHTVRQAVEVLKEEGLLRVDNGLGVFVATPPIKYTIGKRVRYNEMLEAQGHSARYQMLGLTRGTATSKVAECLELELGADIVQYDVLGLSDEHPLIVATSYFPIESLPDILDKLSRFSSISKLMREVYGYDHIRRRTLISSRPVKLKDAKLLKLARNQHILLVQAINENQHGQAIEYTVTRFRSDSVELEFNA